MDNHKKEIPVLLITGYLGSGKTTLLNHILTNEEGVKFAVIVNDIGEINIDAELIQREGIVSRGDLNLVAMQNGCICCTLQNDLVQQIYQLLKMERFDYIVIEASGVCDPAPIAQTICTIPMLGNQYNAHGHLYLDGITTVVDALRMQAEFDCANRLTTEDIEEEDIENLLIQQIEFCNTILLNKASEVTEFELNRIIKILKALQPKAEIIPCDYAKVDLQRLIHTRTFDFSKVASSAGWVQELGKHFEDEHHAAELGKESHDKHEAGCEGGADCHCHHHHHHHNEKGEVEEYGIGTFVYYRRRPFNIDKFEDLVNHRWPINIIRAKGICYFSEQYDMSFLFEQAGTQKQLTQMGAWYGGLSQEDIDAACQREPHLLKDWDEKYGDRMQKLVFIGQHLDRESLCRELDDCLEEE